MVLIGFLDLVTTVVGVVWFGAVEVNPLFSGFGQTTVLFFVGIKSVAIALTGFVFYKGASMAESSAVGSRLGVRFLDFGYLVSLTFLTVVVANNMLTIFQLV